MTQFGKNMMLYTAYWGEAKTFKMLPVTQDCPYVEVIYDPQTTLMVVIGKNIKDTFHFVPRLNENGDPVKPKVARPQGKPIAEQRVSLPMYQEYYLSTHDEQVNFINNFAVNNETFPWNNFLRDLDKEAANPIQPIEKQPIVDVSGSPLTVEK